MSLCLAYRGGPTGSGELPGEQEEPIAEQTPHGTSSSFSSHAQPLS
jgi:hypothetical protein